MIKKRNALLLEIAGVLNGVMRDIFIYHIGLLKHQTLLQTSGR
jgi:hypothetical protein